MSRKKFTPRPNGGGNVTPFPVRAPGPLNVVLRGDAEKAARISYATGRRDAMLALALEMKALEGQFIKADEMIAAIEQAAQEFTLVIEQMQRGEEPAAPTDPEAAAAEKARERLILPQ